MLMWIILSSAFVAVFLLIRALFSNKIKATAMYVLWILVAVRLLVPTYIPVELDLFSNVHIPSITTQIVGVEENTAGIINDVALPGEAENDIVANNAVNTTNPVINETVIANTDTQTTTFFIHPLMLIWLIGMIGFACYFVLSNLKFLSNLRKRRVLLEQFDYNIPVYFVEGLHSPCMAGILHPAIYVNSKTECDKFVLDHEYTHYKHRDNLWMLIQTICLCIHWFNPLVWFASAMFRRDCECACDESVTRTLSHENRILYGKTLLNYVEERRNIASIFSTSTSMSMEGKTMKKRVHIIVNHPPKRIISSIIAVILLIVLFAGAFVVNSSKEENAANTFAHISVEVIEAGVFQDYEKCGSVTRTKDGQTETFTPVSLYYSLWIENTGNADLEDLDFKIVANEEFEHFLTSKSNVEADDLSELYRSYESVLETFSGNKNGIGQLDAYSRGSISCAFELGYDWESLIEKGILKAEDNNSDVKDITDYVLDVTLIIYNDGEELTRRDLSKITEATVSTNMNDNSYVEPVSYELSLRNMGGNEVEINSNQITVLPGDLALSLSEKISDDVVNRRVEGDFIEGGIENAIVNIDYPTEQSWLDGTVVVASEYIMSDVQSGQVITVTITEELQERLGLLDDQIVITCKGYETDILGIWETKQETVIIGDVPEGIENGQTIDCLVRYEFKADGTGLWTITHDEQYSEYDMITEFTYEFDKDNVILKYQNIIDTCKVSISENIMIMDGNYTDAIELQRK